jgi:hypothetical protein
MTHHWVYWVNLRGYHTLAGHGGKMNVLNAIPFPFYGDQFEAYYCDDNEFYVSLNKICEALGIDASGQRQRIQRDQAINDSLVLLHIMDKNGDQFRETACLNLKRLPYWLGTIDANRVKEEQRGRVIMFKREFADAAWAVFRSDLLPADVLAETDQYLSPEQRAYHELMDQARAMQKKLDQLEGIISEFPDIKAILDNIQGRLAEVERVRKDSTFIQPHQQISISEMVHAIFRELRNTNPASN